MKFVTVKLKYRATLIALMLVGGSTFLLASTKPKQNPQQLQAEYIRRIQQETPGERPVTTAGSLWIPGGALADMAADYKARNVGDNVVIQVTEKTTAESTGNVNTQRSFQTNSGITGLPGKIKTAGVNPLFGAQSATTLKGQGASSNTSNLLTSLSGQVIAVLPNGNLVVEAQRGILMNSQHEVMIVRGVLRPGDIGSNNTAPSSALANLEIELKGKGIVSDATRRPHAILRALLMLLTF